MKYLMAAIAGAIFVYCVVIAAGAIWGGANMAAPCHGGASYHPVAERIVGGVIFGALASAVYGALPSVLMGALASPIIVWFLSRMRQSHRPSE